jgi:hypothetical protein
MHVLYEYLFVCLIAFLIINTSVSTILPLIDIHLSQTEEYQLEKLAERIFDKILLTPGYPYNWGEDIRINQTLNEDEMLQYLKDFGLAKIGASPYVLDPNKVIRLENGSGIDNLYYIPPKVISKLLGIEGKYGFQLTIIPALNITIEVSGNTLTVGVYSQEKVPLPASEVTVYAIWVESKGGKDVLNNETKTAKTDWDGKCTLSFSANLEGKGNQEGASFIIYVNFYGIKTVYISSLSQTILASISEKYLAIEYLNGTGALHLESDPLLVAFPNIFYGEITNDTKGESTWVINKGSKSYKVYGLSSIDPYTNYIALIVKKGNNNFLVIAPRPSIVYYATGPIAGVHRVKLTKVVVINDLTYFIEFYLWRMAE